MVSNSMSFGERVFQTTLPAITLTLLVAAHMLRMTRSSVLSVMSTPYIEMAFLKGAPRKRVIVTHGYEAVMVRWLQQQGLQAGSFKTEFGDESEAGESAPALLQAQLA
jgi:ABC-type dipeptide/oligopeptide/nickel transport system permease component